MLSRIRARFAHVTTLASDHPDAALLRQLPSEARVLAALQALSPPVLQAMARDGSRARAVLQALADADLARAVEVLRRRLVCVPGHAALPTMLTLGERAWALGRPQVAYVLVEQRQRTPASYMQHFPRARACWRRLVDQAHIQPATYMRQFVADIDEVALWLQQGRLPEPTCRQLLADAPATLEALEAMGALGTPQALVLRRPPPPKWRAVASEPLPPYVQAAPPQPR